MAWNGRCGEVRKRSSGVAGVESASQLKVDKANQNHQEYKNAKDCCDSQY
jgi:hypothetical protein